MKALILAAGYATRLYPITENQAKPLIKVANKAIVDYIVEKIELINEIDEIFVVTNNKFFNDFVSHFQTGRYKKSITIINDHTLNNEDRLGAVGDLQYVLNKKNIQEDLLVISGDNLFGFSLPDFMSFFKEKGCSANAFYDLKDLNLVKGKYGVGIMNSTKVTDFEEKPMEPRSTYASTGCYLFTKEDLQKVEPLIQTGKADNPGDLIRFLTQESEIHGFVFDEHWFDIGSFESLKQAEELYNEN
jgi:glucose-1-phosphate thymidylyltransferase